MAKRKSGLYITFALLVSDALMINLGILFAYWLRFYSGLIPIFYGLPPSREYVRAAALVTMVLLLIITFYGLYKDKTRRSKTAEFALVAKAVTVGMFILMAITFLYRDFSYSRIVLGLNWLIAISFVGIARLLIGYFELWLRRSRRENRKLLIIGTDEAGRGLWRDIRQNPHLGYEVVGFLATGQDVDDSQIEGVPVLGRVDAASQVISKEKLDEVILTMRDLPQEKIVDIILQCEKEMVDFRLATDLLGMVTSQVDVEYIGGIPLLGLKETPLNGIWNMILKRSMDIACSFLGLILLAPVFLIIAILIRRDSRGPVFYRQERISRDGGTFLLYKFRSMRVGAEEDRGPVWATNDDQRRTKFGAFLRRHSLDELPQLFNVLKGDISLVGPRPERPHFVGQFKEAIPRYMSRHRIKSGMTGWAQVNGLRGDTDISERIKYDLYYIENWSIFFDLKILFMTLFSTKNAY